MSQAPRDRYSDAEEIANGITHGLGALLAAMGLAVLVVSSEQRGTAVHVVSSFVFGLSLLNLYASSTLYHTISSPGAKRILRRLDHAAIFLLIAGSYTPFTLVTLRGPWGWSIFGVVWVLAVIGLFFEGALRRRWVGLSLGLYILMGWVAVAAIKPLLESLPRGGVVLLFAGGWPTPSGRSSTCGAASRSIMPGGTSPCSPAAPCTISRCCSTSSRGAEDQVRPYMPMHCVYCSF